MDATTGLYYYGARYYDVETGRFTQADTIAPNPNDPQSLNRYSYTLNNPLKYVDPTGHFAFLVGVWIAANIEALITYAAMLAGASYAAKEVGTSVGYAIEGDWNTASMHADNALMLEAGVGAMSSYYLVADPLVMGKMQEKQGSGLESITKQGQHTKLNDPLIRDPRVNAEMKKAWSDSNPDSEVLMHEEGGWIMKSGSNHYVSRWPQGERTEVTPSPIPRGGKLSGEFHTHPPVKGYAWDKPSDPDFDAANYISRSYNLPNFKSYIVNKEGLMCVDYRERTSETFKDW